MRVFELNEAADAFSECSLGQILQIIDFQGSDGKKVSNGMIGALHSEIGELYFYELPGEKFDFKID